MGCRGPRKGGELKQKGKQMKKWITKPKKKQKSHRKLISVKFSCGWGVSRWCWIWTLCRCNISLLNVSWYPWFSHTLSFRLAIGRRTAIPLRASGLRSVQNQYLRFWDLGKIPSLWLAEITAFSESRCWFFTLIPANTNTVDFDTNSNSV